MMKPLFEFLYKKHVQNIVQPIKVEIHQIGNGKVAKIDTLQKLNILKQYIDINRYEHFNTYLKQNYIIMIQPKWEDEFIGFPMRAVDNETYITTIDINNITLEYWKKYNWLS